MFEQTIENLSPDLIKHTQEIIRIPSVSIESDAPGKSFWSNQDSTKSKLTSIYESKIKKLNNF